MMPLFLLLLATALVVAAWFHRHGSNASLVWLLVVGLVLALRLQQERVYPPLQPDTSVVPRMLVQEARQKLAAGRALLVDYRAEHAFKKGHVDGAVNVPSERRLRELPYGKLLIVYCA